MFTLIVVVSVLFVGIACLASETVRSTLISSVAYFMYGLPNQEDRRQADLIVDEIIKVHHFPRNSLSQPAGPPVFAQPGSEKLLSQPTVVTIYEVPDRADQDRIVAAIKQLLEIRKFKPVDLRFYDRENWIQTDHQQGMRGNEVLLRQVHVI